MNLNSLSIREAAAGLRKKEFSARELTADCLAAIEKQKNLNAFLTISQSALRDAEAIDELIAAGGTLPPLGGIPVALKDNILASGARATAGSKMLEHYEASYDATVTTKLKRHGAIILGKTNLDEFAMGSSTENSAFGPTKNPHDTTRVPGGSSGGSAAAVAGNLCLGALGSDTGGSIRQPAALCGVVGMKSTYGRVSRHGLIAMASSLDQIGPLAKTVHDARIIFETIAGADAFDATTAPRDDLPFPSEDEPLDPKRITIGVPKEYFGKGLDADVKEVVMAQIAVMERHGMRVKEISLPHSDYALATYYIVVPSEVSANLARFDGIRYGHQSSRHKTLTEVYRQSRAEGFGAEVKRRIMLGTYTLSTGYYDAYYLKAQKVRTLIRNDFQKAFADVDVIAGPTTPTPAFALGEKNDNPLHMYLADIYTVAANLAGIPAISIPAGAVTRNGQTLPVGLQLAGSWFDEYRLLQIAELFANGVKNS